MRIATHNGSFHADEVLAIATLEIAGIAGVDDVIRTRDPSVLAECDMRIDVGDRNDPATGDFDHHQKGGAGSRPNGVPYAAFGLIWKAFGLKAAGSVEAAQLIDERLVQPSDTVDNGADLIHASVPGLIPYDIDRIVSRLRPSWREDATDEEMDQAFRHAVKWAGEVLVREITVAQDEVTAVELVRAAIADNGDHELLELSGVFPWKNTVVKEAPQVLLVVQPGARASGGGWTVQTVPLHLGSFKYRLSLPQAWAGKRDEELFKASGVEDAIFCHNARFLAGAESRAGALALAHRALAAGERA